MNLYKVGNFIMKIIKKIENSDNKITDFIFYSRIRLLSGFILGLAGEKEEVYIPKKDTKIFAIIETVLFMIFVPSFIFCPFFMFKIIIFIVYLSYACLFTAMSIF